MEVLTQFGHYLSIVLFLVLTGCGLPVPEEIPIIAAGVASSVGHLNPWGALAACLIGAVLGDTALYAIGYHFGHSLIKVHPRLARLLHAEDEAKMEQLVNQYGLKILFATRFMVGIRAPVYLSIGILRIPYRKFLLYDVFCATTVVSFFFGLSYMFGDRVTAWIRGTEKVITIIAVAALVVGLLVFWTYRRRAKSADAVDSATENGATAELPENKPSEADNARHV